MTYEDIVSLISRGTIVYAINENKDIIEGKIVSIVNYREALSSNVNSDAPDVKLSDTFSVTIRKSNGENEHVSKVFLTGDDVKASLNTEIDGEIQSLVSILTKAGIESKAVSLITAEKV